MSNEALTWAWGLRGIRGTVKLVLVRLADFAGARGESWPLVETICEDTGLKADAVSGAIKELVAGGLLYRTSQWRSTPQGGRRSPQYILLYCERSRAFALDNGWAESNAQVNAQDDDEADEVENGAEDGAEGNPDETGLAPNGAPGKPGAAVVASRGATPTRTGRNPDENGPAYKARTINEPSLTPPPPSGGVEGPAASRWKQFETAWPFDAADLVEPARKVFGRLGEGDQALAVKWAGNYLDLMARQQRRRMSAANWLRGKGWAAFAISIETAATPQVWIERGSAQWRAWRDYFAIADPSKLKRAGNGEAQLIALETRRGFGRYMPSEWPPSAKAIAGGVEAQRDGSSGARA